MILTITSKRQVTFPASVLAALGAKPGDKVELLPSPDGFVLRLRVVDITRLGTLCSKIPVAAPPFDLQVFRAQRHDATLRD